MSVLNGRFDRDCFDGDVCSTHREEGLEEAQ